MSGTKLVKSQPINLEPEGDNICERCCVSFMGASTLCPDCEDKQEVEERAS